MRRFLVAFSAAFLLAGVSASHAESELPTLGDTARAEFSPAQEAKVGRFIMNRIRSDPDFVTDPVLTEYLTTLGNRMILSDASLRGELMTDFTFFPVRDPTLNAFAMPGGYIGVHTGLILATANESELASVMAHEIGHVSQRHIARMISASRHDYLFPIAAAALAVLAARAGGDLANAVMMGGQGLTMQKQINFTRDAEKEADRIGYQILRNSGFDTSGMVSFFTKMQNATRSYGDAPSPYLRTHPLTSDRIADAAARAAHERYIQHADDIDFYLMRPRARIIQDMKSKGLDHAQGLFELQVKSGSKINIAAGSYGLAVIAMTKSDYATARAHYNRAAQALGKRADSSIAMNDLKIRILMKTGELKKALAETNRAMLRFSVSKTLAHRKSEILMALKQYGEAVRYLKEETRRQPDDPVLVKRLAEAYDRSGKKALMHLTMSDLYAMTGGYQSALEQLNLARKAKDVTFYVNSVIDAKEREYRAIILEEKKQEGGWV